jgi:hypothetical protein
MWFALLLPLTAHAGGVLSLNPVFVSRFDATDADTKDDAARLRGALEKRLDSEFVRVRREDVPAFEDYSAEVYLQSCAPAQTVGCAYVIGARAEAEWAVTGVVAPGQDAAFDVTITFVDVADGRVAFSFSMAVASVTDPRLLDAVAEVLHRATEGRMADSDVRGQIEDPKEAFRKAKERAAMLAKSLDGLDIGARPAATTFEEIERPKLTRRDLEAYDKHEEEKPWDLVGLSQAEYLRFKNSGLNITEWREASKGRAGRVVIGFGGGYGTGPFGTEYDGRRVLDRAALSVVETEAIQGAFNSASARGDLDVTLGVLPWLEVGAVVRTRQTPFDFRFYSEFQGEPEILRDFVTDATPLFEAGAKINAVFMPTQALHPTAGAVVGAWAGVGIGQVSEMPDGLTPIPAPGGVLIQVAPGVEYDISKAITVGAHLDAGLRLGGAVAYQHTGVEALTNRVSPRSSTPLTLEFAAGLRVKLPRLWGNRAASASDE